MNTTVSIESSWKLKLEPEFSKPYFLSLIDFVKQEYSKTTCYPPGPLIFNAFEHSPFDKVKVVILGQDPYFNPQQANGLCFSVYDGVKIPPSLVNIFKEIKLDLGIEIPKSGDLSRWADQGVLLLNATLTVRGGEAGSHQKHGWETFTDEVIAQLNAHREGLVFMLWGAYAQKKGSIVDQNKHLVLKAPHPSPLAAHRGFFGSNHFSKANAYLKSRGESEINW